MPKVSIIMGIFNVGSVLEASLQSIVNQSFSDWELIMCDDGSTDNTFEVANKFAKEYKSKIILIKNDSNMGLEKTLNRCLAYAKGDYIARQDGDDISKLDRLCVEVDFLDNHPEYALVGSNMHFFDDHGIWGRSYLDGEVDYSDFAHGSPFMHPTVLIRKNALDAVGGYLENTKLVRVEDYILWFDLYKNGFKGYNIEKPLYEYRDDRIAFSKRTTKNRLSLFVVMIKAIKQFHLPGRYYIFPLKQLLLVFVPQELYAILHRLKYKR